MGLTQPVAGVLRGICGHGATAWLVGAKCATLTPIHSTNLAQTLFLFITTMAIVGSAPLAASDGGGSAIARTVLIAATFGLAIAVLVFALGGASGGHLNPVATLAIALHGGVSPLRAVMYVVAQMCGACVGAALTRSLDAPLYDAAGGGANVLSTTSAGVTA